MKTEFKHVALAMRDLKPHVQVVNFRNASLAVHKTVWTDNRKNTGWTITHIRSGKIIFKNFKTLKHAKNLVLWLESIADWSKNESDLINDRVLKDRMVVMFRQLKG